MKTVRVVVNWPAGLHARPASRLVRLARTFRSRIIVRTAHAVADGRSILSILTLCASMNTVLEIQAEGEDEELAVRAVGGLFQDPDARDEPGGTPRNRQPSP
jgi:phosphotransferase system HPr (HPr) family protein